MCFRESSRSIADAAAASQCAPRKDDPYLLGYFIANEPPWPGRESLVVDVILERPPSAIQREAKAFLADGDTPERRKQFVYRAFEKYLQVINAAVRKHDPNHLNLGLRFGGSLPPAEMLRASAAFDVYSLNVYATSVDRESAGGDLSRDRPADHCGRISLRRSGTGPGARPGAGSGSGGARSGLPILRGAGGGVPGIHRLELVPWVDQPNTGRMDGENYNIGLVDVTDRPYCELIEAMKTTHRRLQAVHGGTVEPIGAGAVPHP